jgi:hypothetical protein
MQWLIARGWTGFLILSWKGEDEVWMDDGFMPSLTEVRSPNSTSMLTYPQRGPRHCSSLAQTNTLENSLPSPKHFHARASCPKRRRRLRRNAHPLRASNVDLVTDFQPLLAVRAFGVVKQRNAASHGPAPLTSNAHVRRRTPLQAPIIVLCIADNSHVGSIGVS